MRPALSRIHWTTIAPLLAAAALGIGWGRSVPGWAAAVLFLVLGAAVMSAVHHAEVIAHRVGEPFGSLILALAVTVIEVGMIVMLMLGGGPGIATLATETVFAAAMLTTNLIVGLSLVVATRTRRGRLAHFNAEGSGAALASVLVIATTTLVVPTVTTSSPGRTVTGSQLAFAAVSALVTWAVFVLTQTRRHRDFFLPVDAHGAVVPDTDHAAPPSGGAVAWSGALLVVALVSIVGLAKTLSGPIEAVVAGAGLPSAVVGVVIAMLVLLPETVAAIKNSARGRTQVALNLAYGSALASIGLTVPAVAVLVTVLHLPLELGLDRLHITLLVLTGIVGALTVVPGRATRLQGALHLVIAGCFLFLTAVP